MPTSFLSHTSSPSSGLFKDKGSKFLAFSFPVTEIAEIEQHLRQLKKEYYDARHHCYAYRLGKEGNTQFATDDGEPSHSAGDPILGAIRSEELTNILIVVVRYFGGIKLGVRGLIEAYRTAALASLEGIPRKMLIPEVIFSVDFTYDQTSDINRLLHPFELRQKASEYTDRCKLTFSIEKSHFPPVQEVLERALLNWNILHED